jgi:hypothetical protein
MTMAETIVDPGPDRLVRLGFAFREAKTLLSAIELDVFTALSTHGPLGLEELARRTSVHPRGARDFFDTLVSLRLLERDDAGHYRPTPETGRYLNRNNPYYIGGELEFASARQFGPWSLFTEALRTGTPQSGARGTENYSAYYAQAAILENVAKGMSGGTLLAAEAMAERFPWREYQTLCDVGTAQGCLPVAIAGTHGHIHGVGFDLPPLQRLFEDYVGQQGLADRLRFQAGDFFKDPLPTADVLVMGRVLHNWDLTAKKLLLKKAYEALPVGGALIVYERLIDDERRSSTSGLTASLNMLVMTASGFDFTGADCIGWMKEADFKDCRVVPLTSILAMVIGTKTK